MKKLHWFTLLLTSAAACFLQAKHLLTGFDAQGFPLTRGLFGSFPLLPALAAFAALFFFLCRKAPAASDISADFPAVFDFSGTFSLFLAVCGIFMLFASAGLSLLTDFGYLLDMILAVLLAISAAALLYALVALRKGKTAGTAMLVPLCYLMLLLVLTYRTFAKDPVVAHYYIYIVSLALLGWAGLQLAAFAFRNGSARSYLPFAMLAVAAALPAAVAAQSVAQLLMYGGFAVVHLAFLSAFSLKD